jgi:hypothetical protein
VAYLALIFWALTICLVYGHEDEQWIADKSLQDPVSKQYCCGPRDCKIFPDDWVKVVPEGYRIGFEFVPEYRALPVSPDGHYHRCTDAKGATRCFIVPPRQS